MSRYYANNPDDPPISHDWTGAAHRCANPRCERDTIPSTEKLSQFDQYLYNFNLIAPGEATAHQEHHGQERKLNLYIDKLCGEDDAGRPLAFAGITQVWSDDWSTLIELPEHIIAQAEEELSAFYECQ